MTNNKIVKKGKFWVYRGIKFNNKEDAENVKKADAESNDDDNDKVFEQPIEKTELLLLHEENGPKRIGYYVNEYLDKNGKNISELSKELGVSRTTLYSWIKSESIPKINQVTSLLKIFKLSEDQFIEAFNLNAVNALKLLYKKAS